MKSPCLAGLRVFLIDNDPDTRDLFTFILTTEAAEVADAASVEEALGAVGKFKPDVILSDLYLPDADGFSWVHQLRSLLNEQKPVPIIAVTAFAGEEGRLSALSAGFQEHLPKPVSPDDLVATIALLSQRSQALD